MMLLNSDNSTETKKLKTAKKVTHASTSSSSQIIKHYFSSNLFYLFYIAIACSLAFPQNSSSSSLPPRHILTVAKLAFIHSFMASKLFRNRMKHKDEMRSDNVLALEKAAAWAWYQHGSGSDGKTSMRESHVPRIHQRDHRPSRYKLEAIKMASPSSSTSQETEEEEGLSCPVHHTNKLLPLLDAYEVRSILTKLDSFMSESSDDKLDNGYGSANGGQRMTKKKVGKGIWERPRVRMLCSPRKDDVVDETRVSKESHQLSAAKCSMPRANGGRVM